MMKVSTSTLLLKLILLLLLLWMCSLENQQLQKSKKDEETNTDGLVGQRHKRYLTVPKGTVIQLVYCYLMAGIGTRNIFTVGVTLGLNWDVPTDLNENANLYPGLKIGQKSSANNNNHRKDRRIIYDALHYLLVSAGIEQEDAGLDKMMFIKKLLCDSMGDEKGGHQQRPSSSLLQLRNGSFIAKIINKIFKYPEPSATSYEPRDKFDWFIENC